MKIFLLRLTKKITFYFFILSVVSACAPGTMRMEKGVGSVKNTDGTEQPVAIIPITADLLRELNEIASKKINTGLEEIFSGGAVYKIGAADVLQIVVWDHPELVPLTQQTGAISNSTDPVTGFVVSSSGEIQFPYVGILKVSGLTETEIRERLQEKLEKYLVNPQITVRVASYRSKRIFVDGEVKSPGIFPLNDIPMTLYEAVNRAGGFLLSADQSNLLLIRKGRVFQINFSKLIQIGLDPAKIILQNGDALRISNREASKVYLLGEIGKPLPVSMRNNGMLTLTEALGEGSGINPLTADAGHIYVLRNNPEMGPEIFHLDASSPISLLMADEFELKSRDVIYVDASRLARFNRAISLLLPAGGFANNATNIANSLP